MRNGWEGTMMDNKRGLTRIAEIEGFYTEIGSVYAHDITAAKAESGHWVYIEYTEKEIKCKEMNEAIFG